MHLNTCNSLITDYVTYKDSQMRKLGYVVVEKHVNAATYL